jgi:hypothetical protein
MMIILYLNVNMIFIKVVYGIGLMLNKNVQVVKKLCENKYS